VTAPQTQELITMMDMKIHEEELHIVFACE